MNCLICENLAQQFRAASQQCDDAMAEFRDSLLDIAMYFRRDEIFKRQEAAVQRCAELAELQKQHAETHYAEFLEFAGGTVN